MAYHFTVACIVICKERGTTKLDTNKSTGLYSRWGKGGCMVQ